MSKPRKPFGANQPGRLPATMIKVLAAELSESGRLSRGKRYWAENCVTDIVIGHGAVTGEVQGSRPEPYVATIEAQPGDGVPGKRETWVACTCPDDDGTGNMACKHAVAVLFALADEVAIEPDVIARWRKSGRVTHLPRPEPSTANRSTMPATARATVMPTMHPDERCWPTWYNSDPAHHGGPSPATPRVLLRMNVASRSFDGGVSDLADEIGPMLRAPSPIPLISAPTPFEPPRPADRPLADVLHDALRHLHVDWS